MRDSLLWLCALCAPRAFLPGFPYKSGKVTEAAVTCAVCKRALPEGTEAVPIWEADMNRATKRALGIR